MQKCQPSKPFLPSFCSCCFITVRVTLARTGLTRRRTCVPRRKHIFPRQSSYRQGQGRERIDGKGKCLIFPHTLPWNLPLSAGAALSFESRWAAVQLSGRLLAPHPLPPPCSFFSTAEEKHSGKRIPAHCVLLSALGCIRGSGSSSRFTC